MPTKTDTTTKPVVTAPTVTWGIANLDRNLADGKVTAVHWTVNADDGTYSAGAYGSIGLDGEIDTPFKDLTPDIVIGWVKSHFGEDKVAEIQNALFDQLQAQREPKTGSGLPW